MSSYFEALTRTQEWGAQEFPAKKKEQEEKARREALTAARTQYQQQPVVQSVPTPVTSSVSYGPGAPASQLQYESVSARLAEMAAKQYAAPAPPKPPSVTIGKTTISLVGAAPSSGKPEPKMDTAFPGSLGPSDTPSLWERYKEGAELRQEAAKEKYGRPLLEQIAGIPGDVEQSLPYRTLIGDPEKYPLEQTISDAMMVTPMLAAGRPLVGAAKAGPSFIQGAAQKLGAARAALQARPVAGGAVAGVTGFTGGQLYRGATDPEQAEDTKLTQTAAGLRAGTGRTMELFGKGAKFRGKEELGNWLINKGQEIAKGFELEPHEFESYGKALRDPRLYTVNLAQTIPATLALIPMMWLGYRAGKSTGQTMGLNPFASTLMGAATGSVASRPVESLLEAGDAYSEAMEEGKSEDEARAIGEKVFKGNMSLMALDAFQLAVAFAPLPKFMKGLKKTTKGKVAVGAGRLAGVGFTEGPIEENYQEALQQLALGHDDRPIIQQMLSPTLQQKEAILLGALIGIGMGSAGVIVDTLRDDPDLFGDGSILGGKVTPEGREFIKAKFEEYSQTGMSDDAAMLEALGDFAGTEEGLRLLAEAEAAVSEPEAQTQEQLTPDDKAQIRAAMEEEFGTTQEVPTVTQKAVEATTAGRRKDFALRTEIDKLSPEEKDEVIRDLREHYFKDELTGLKNRAAYLMDEKQPYQAVLDLDNLKWVNDNIGHGAGDTLIKVLANELPDNAYHLSGDEFVIQGRSEEELKALLSGIESRLSEQTIELAGDKRTVAKRGIGFGYGIGETLEKAETALQQHKKARLEAGKRVARGETPAGIVDAKAEAPVKTQPPAAEKPAPTEPVKDVAPGAVPGGVFRHFTTPEGQAAIHSGQPFDFAKEPQHGTGDLGLGPKTGRFMGDYLYLSLDDKRWSQVLKETGKGKIVPATTETAKQGIPFYDYDKQQWMVQVGGHEQVQLHSVEYRISPDARVLVINSEASFRAALDEAAQISGKRPTWDSPATWDALAERYDVVALQNVREVAEKTDHKFFKSAAADQLVVLNSTVAEVVRPAAKPKPAVKSAVKPEATASTKEPWQMTREELEVRYRTAGDIVDGRTVRSEVPNMSSIDSSIDNPAVLKGMYEIPLSEFEGLSGKHYSASGTERIKKLAGEISDSKEINPLIVVIDSEGPYILEGATRAEALYKLGATSFPAKVVIDEGSFYEATKQALSEGKPVPPEVLKDYPDLAKAVKPEPEAKEPTKEPWQMTLLEYAKNELIKANRPGVAAQLTSEDQAKSYRAQYIKDLQGWQREGKVLSEAVRESRQRAVEPAMAEALSAEAADPATAEFLVIEARIKEIHTNLSGAKVFNPAYAEKYLRELEKDGVEVQDALDALQDYRDTVREDFDSTEEYKDARSEAKDAFLDAVDELEVPEVEQADKTQKDEPGKPVETKPELSTIEEKAPEEGVKPDETESRGPGADVTAHGRDTEEAGDRPLEGAPSEDVPGTAGERGTERRPRQRGPEHPEGRRGDDEAAAGAEPATRDGGLPGTPEVPQLGEADSVGTGTGRVDTAPERAGAAEPVKDKAPKPKRDTRVLPGNNYIIKDTDLVGMGGKKTKFKNNLAAIRLVKQLETEGRLATPEEQEILVKYVGWGGIPEVFKYNLDEGDEWYNEQQALKQLLTDEEWRTAVQSVQNAHYTSPTVVKAMWELLDRLGFKGGRVLEPSMGIGHFFGLMPQELAANSKLTGIELDNITGAIAKQLYQKADVRVQGFQEMRAPDNFYDLAISNVPFGDYKIADSKYDKYKFRIHNYFFAKALDKVHPGGLVAFITSTGTMQSSKDSATLREWLSQRADLVGAIRLPNNTFKENASTEVVTDLIVLQKRKPGEAAKGEAWTELDYLGDLRSKYGRPLATNEYYVNNPEMMLGNPVDDKMWPGRLGLESDGRNISDAMREAFKKFPENIYAESEIKTGAKPLTLEEMVPAPNHVKENAYTIRDGKVFQNKEGNLLPVDLPAATLERITGMCKVRDAASALRYGQLKEDLTDKQFEKLREALNDTYDAFVRKHGYLSDPVNERVFREDPDSAFLLSLESEVEGKGKKKVYAKAAFFEKRTIASVKTIESADTAQDALIASLSERGRVDLKYMAALMGNRPTAEIVKELKGVIYNNPVTRLWETSEEYLSGNVRQKLAEAEAAAKTDHEVYQDNVEALKNVQPEDLTPNEIEVNLGAPWVPPDVIQDLIDHLIGGYGNVSVQFVPMLGTWDLKWSQTWNKNSFENINKWGTRRKSAVQLIEASLNQRAVTIYDEDADGKRTVNQAETFAAREKQEKIREEFSEWVWKETNRRQRMLQIYNDEYNNIRLRTFDGSHINPPGLNPEINLRPHQKNGVWRVLSAGKALLAHTVGAGKTWTMQVAGMEMRRLGLAKKPMYVVPNHMLRQFTDEFYTAYPSANLLVISSENLPSVEVRKGKADTDVQYAQKKAANARKRQVLLNRIGTGDWDGVIMTYTTFEKIPVSPELQNRFIEQQIEDVEKAILELKAAEGSDKDTKLVKQLAKMRDRLRANLIRDLDAARKDIAIPFEELGVDYMFVDEADNFKNLYYVTKMNRVAGLPQSKAKRAMDMFMKTQRLQEANNGRGVTFATGTPISNTMAEMYTMKRYLAMDELRSRSLAHFDSWAANFGRIMPVIELSPDGSGWRQNNRFAQFVNAPEMITMFRSFADVQTKEMLNLPIPKMKSGGPITDVAEPSDALTQYMEFIGQRAEDIRKRLVTPKEDNMLKITVDGRKSSLDMDLVTPGTPFDENGKVGRMISRVHEIWEESKGNSGAQLVFCDLSTPKGASDKITDTATDVAEAEIETAAESRVRDSVYEKIKRKLVEKGIPANEIAFIHDAKKDDQKRKLMTKVNRGEIRVLIGSTEKMGTGMNAQRKLVALHHLDCPWRPRDLEQRDGRILRQGNENEEVYVYRWVTQAPALDAWMWQTIEGKARFIAQAMSGNITARTMEDIDAMVPSAAQTKALATGDPRMQEKVVVDTQVVKYQRLHSKWKNDRYSMQDELTRRTMAIDVMERDIERIGKDVKARVDTLGDKFSITLDGKTYAKREEADAELRRLVHEHRKDSAAVRVGKFGHFDVYVKTYQVIKRTPEIILKGHHEYTANVSIQSVEYIPRTLEKSVANKEQILGQSKSKIAAITEELTKSFEHVDKLKELLARQNQLEIELGMRDIAGQQIMEDAEESETSGYPAVSGFPAIRGARRYTSLRKQEAAPTVPEASMDEYDTSRPTVTKIQMIKTIEERFSMPLFTGRLRSKKHAGEYYEKGQYTRIAKQTDFEAISHELGHHLGKLLEIDFKKPNSELEEMGRDLYPDQTNAVTLRKEGFAELVRLYMMDPDAMQDKAPTSFIEFQNMLLEPSNEITRDAVYEVRGLYQAFFGLDPVERVSGHIVGTKSIETKKWLSPKERLYTLLYDAGFPLMKLVQEAHGASKTEKFRGIGERPGDFGLNAIDNPYILYRVIGGGRFARIQEYLTGDMETVDGKLIPGLLKILEPVRDYIIIPNEELKPGDTPEDWARKTQVGLFETYLTAKHAIERHAFKDEKGRPKPKVTGIEDADAQATVRRLEKEHPEFKKAAEQLYDFQNAILERLVKAGVLKQESLEAMREAYKAYVPMHRFFEGDERGGGLRGGGRRMVDTGSGVKRAYGSERLILHPLETIYRNSIYLIDLAGRNQIAVSLVEMVEEQDIEGMGHLMHRVPTPVKPLRADLAQIREMLEEVGVDVESIGGDATLESMALTFMPAKYSYGKEKKENIAVVMKNGVPTFYRFHPELYRVMQTMEEGMGGWMTKVFRPFASTLRAGAIFTPEFIIRNPLRDIMHATVMGGFAPWNFIEGIFHTAKQDELYKSWVRGGGPTSTFVAADRDIVKSELRKALKNRLTTGEKVADVLIKPYEALVWFADFTEKGTRVGTYARTLREETRKGTPKKEAEMRAVYKSREISVDFGRRGPVSQEVNQISAFFNAAIQGPERSYREFKRNPHLFMLRGTLWITLPTVLIFLNNYDDDRYWDLTQFERDFYWIIFAGDTVFKIPKPFEVGIIFGTMQERALAWMLQKDKKAFKGLDDSLKDIFLPPVIPNLLAPIFEAYSNQSFLTGYDLLPSRVEKLDKPEQYTQHTTELMKMLGKMFNQSPAVMENYVRGWTGGLGMHFLHFLDFLATKGGTMVKEGPGAAGRQIKEEWAAKEAGDVVGVRAFIAKPKPGRAAVNEFYEIKEELEMRLATARSYYERKEQIPRKYLLTRAEKAQLDRLRKADKALQDGRSKLRQVQTSKDLTPEQKKKREAWINRRMGEIAANASKGE